MYLHTCAEPKPKVYVLGNFPLELSCQPATIKYTRLIVYKLLFIWDAPISRLQHSTTLFFLDGEQRISIFFCEDSNLELQVQNARCVPNYATETSLSPRHSAIAEVCNQLNPSACELRKMVHLNYLGPFGGFHNSS